MQKTVKLESFDSIEQSLSILTKIYDIVRIVDPLKKTARLITTKGIVKQELVCYTFWNQNKICDNCISIRAYNEETTFVKLEFNGKELYMVTAAPLTIDKDKFVLELLENVTDTLILEGVDPKNPDATYEKINKLNSMIVKDELTGAYNRRFINERLDADILRAISQKLPLSVIMTDIDFFKNVNDMYGHAAGDEVLKQFVKIIQKNIRSETDWVARYGGEEFLICLNNTDANKAYYVAERIRKEVENSIIQFENISIKITASFGIATLSDKIIPAVGLIKIADEKLYEAKNSGRNKVVI